MNQELSKRNEELLELTRSSAAAEARKEAKEKSVSNNTSSSNFLLAPKPGSTAKPSKNKLVKRGGKAKSEGINVGHVRKSPSDLGDGDSDSVKAATSTAELVQQSDSNFEISHESYCAEEESSSLDESDEVLAYDASVVTTVIEKQRNDAPKSSTLLLTVEGTDEELADQVLSDAGDFQSSDSDSDEPY